MVRKPWDVLPIWGPILAPLGRLNALAQAARRRRYERRPQLVHRFDVPVISVGNLVVGGSGKTPFVDLLLEILPDSLKPALVLARGYGSSLEVEGVLLDEEGHQLRRRHPEALIAQGADRVTAAEPHLSAARSIILDDGAQHLRIARNLEVLLIDATELARPRYVLPAGPWREDLEAATQADLIVLSRCDEATPRDLERARAVSSGRFPKIPTLLARHAPWALRGPGADDRPLTSLAEADVVAVSGIARPDSFVSTLSKLGARLVKRVDFADHQAYGPNQVARVEAALVAAPRALLVTTAKDALKLSRALSPEALDRLLVLEVRLELDDPSGELAGLLAGLVDDPGPPG